MKILSLLLKVPAVAEHIEQLKQSFSEQWEQEKDRADRMNLRGLELIKNIEERDISLKAANEEIAKKKTTYGNLMKEHTSLLERCNGAEAKLAAIPDESVIITELKKRISKQGIEIHKLKKK